MKIRVVVTKRTSILDPEGETIRRALQNAPEGGALEGVRVGKTFELKFAEGTSPGDAQRQAKKMAEDLLVNAVMEDFRIEVLA